MSPVADGPRPIDACLASWSSPGGVGVCAGLFAASTEAHGVNRTSLTPTTGWSRPSRGRPW